MKTISQLTDFYYNTLYPQILELEKERKALKERMIKFAIFIGAVAFILFYFLTDKLHRIDSFVLVLFIIPLLGLASFIYKFMTKDYASSFKLQIIEPLIKEIDENLRYNPTYKIDQQTFINSEIFKGKIDRYNGNDYVTGSIDGVQISFSDLHVEKEEKDSKGRSNYRTIFQGLFIVTSFNKYFSNSTIILPDSAQSLFGSLIGGWLQSNNFSRSQLVKMDDPEFEKEFVVYGTDQIEARYILSHSMMQRILELKKKTAKPIYLSFKDEQMNLAVAYDKDLFEPSVFSSLLEYKVAMEYIKTLQLTLSLVTELKLNEKLWSKR